MTPEISVQVPVRNGGAGFAAHLDSLRAQDLAGVPWELVIADDGSSPPVEGSFDLRFPDPVTVRVIRREGPGNRPAARNAASREASAPLSLLTDGDLRLAPDVLRRHLELRRVGGWTVVMGARINAWSAEASPWQRWFDTRAMGGKPAGEFPPRYFITGNLSLPTALLRDAGGFDEAIDRYGGEDTEFGLRLARKGVSLHWEPELRVYHLDTVTVREHSVKMVEYGGGGLRYTLKKHPEARGMLGSEWIRPVLSRPATLEVTAMRLIARLMLLPVVYRGILRWMEVVGRPRFLFTYLSVGGCLLGLSGKSFRRKDA
jgi:glycosyltransferase involved in cell wall biosynthesis